MAGSVSPAGNIAEGVVEIYAEAERLILARMAAYLKKDSEAPDWMERKLLEVQFLKRQTAHLVNDLGNRAASEVAVALAHAYNRGGAAAAADLAGLLKISLLEASAPTYGLPPVELLVSELMGNLNAAGKQILRSTDDAFRRIVAESAAQVLTGTQTRLQATQTALDRFAQQGIPGFINRADQNMNIASYAEMATRTSASKAFRQASTDRIQQYGLDLVIVPDTPGSCPLCSPWEGQVLSISGDTPGYSTVADAEAGGLGHPNCTHAYSAYQEGFTPELKPALDDAKNAELYANNQKLRYLERKTREAKRLEAAAMDPVAARQAKAKVATYQAKIREHVNNTSVKRLTYREQIGQAH